MTTFKRGVEKEEPTKDDQSLRVGQPGERNVPGAFGKEGSNTMEESMLVMTQTEMADSEPGNRQ